mmetsp:Transcript_40064/g.64995  ORF Transcript_40064/g.64995 Transcript_40064/m.64995 type:complete len:464 (+) Transcript_40064:51-1442(+)
MATCTVGQRIASGASIGTVRWVGKLPGNDDNEWLGVEWDDYGRGKHDGTFSETGEKMFTCAPGQGSFLKPEKVNIGVSVVAALLDRYCDIGTVQAVQGSEDSASSELYVPSSRGNKVPVQLVGMDKVAQKQSRVDKLSKVSVRDSYISSAGPVGEIAEKCPSVSEMDLSNNLLSDWQTLSQVTRQLPRLHTLLLSGNLLKPFDQTAELEGAFSSLRVLVLNSTRFTWSQVPVLQHYMPLLEELHLCHNHIRSLGSSEENIKLKTLRILNLEGNGLEDWVEVWKLSQLPVLERLIVNDNKLREVTYKTSVEVSNTPFASLQSISLSKNCITEWSSVDALNAFPSLVELRLQNNPITDSAVISPALVRQFIIARIGQLNLMNGSQVRPKERADAEKAYIKLTLAEAVDKGQSVNSFLSDPNTTILFPRLKRLVEVHGVPDVPKASSNVGTLADSILCILMPLVFV